MNEEESMAYWNGQINACEHFINILSSVIDDVKSVKKHYEYMARDEKEYDK